MSGKGWPVSRLPASCFGKLPIHGDFIRHQVPAAEIEIFDQWIQGGLLSARSAVGTGWEQEFDSIPPSRFLYNAPQTGRVMAGVFTASQDRTGRRFPFLVFTLLDPRTLGTNVTLLPTYLAAFMDRAEEAATQGWRGKDLR